MGWAIFGIVVVFFGILGWGFVAVAGFEDDAAMRRYERQRQAFEDLFDD